MNSLNLEIYEIDLSEDCALDLSQTQRIALRLIQAGERGVLTGELFSGLYSAKYTARISELRAQGHRIPAVKEELLAGGRSTEQWRYTYAGFEGRAEGLSRIVSEALCAWEDARGIRREEG